MVEIPPTSEKDTPPPSAIISSELLNSVKYNYGKLTDSSSCCSFQKSSNRLAICTEKSLIIINLNLNWPKAREGVTPAKLRKNYDKATSKQTASSSEFTKSSYQIDAWVQDLVDNKNNLLSINLISSTDKSAAVEDVYRDFFGIEESFKRKPFHRQIRDLVDSNKTENSSISINEITETEELCSIDSNIKIIESNMNQYLRHKQIIEQHKIYDTNLYDYISCLNPINNPNQQSNPNPNAAQNLPFNYFNYGFKYCKWNKNSSLQLLCAINACNQLFIFNCTHLNKANTPINQQANNLESKDLNDPKSYNKIFEPKSGSTVINLTELFLYKYRKTTLMDAEKPKTVTEYINRITQLMPMHLNWSKPFQLASGNHSKMGQLLFTSMKSNEIICFLVMEGEDYQIAIDLVGVLRMPKAERMVEDDDEASVPSLLSFFVLDADCSNRISCVEFWNDEGNKFGVLACGQQNGDIYLSDLDLADLTNWQPRYFKLQDVYNMGAIESIRMYKIVECNECVKFLLVAKRESSLIFCLIDYDYGRKEFKQKHLPQFYNDHDIEPESKSASQLDNNKKINYLIQTYYKLIKIKLINKRELNNNKFIFEFWLIFENTHVKHLNCVIELIKSESSTDIFEVEKFELDKQARLINDSIQLKFDVGNNNKRQQVMDMHAQFKMTRELFFSSHDCVMFQVNDYSKLELMERKLTQLEINVYWIRPQRQLMEMILPTSSEMIENSQGEGCIELKKFYFKGIIELADLIWLFKRSLYLNRAFFNFTVFQRVYANIKFANKLADTNINDDMGFLIYLKRMRLIMLYLGNYFEHHASFEYLNGGQEAVKAGNEDNCDMDEDNESVPDEAEVDVSKNECSIIKSASYYWSVFREYSLCLFKYHALKLVYHAIKVGFKNLKNKERLVLLLVGDFSIKKNFFSSVEHKDIHAWLEDNYTNIDATKITDKFNSRDNLISLCNKIKCDLCGKSLRIDLSKELNSIECELGHVMARCQRSLLPLNSRNFKACTKCNSVWNILDPTDYPNFNELEFTQNACIFCK